jgi:hypothetical protein
MTRTQEEWAQIEREIERAIKTLGNFSTVGSLRAGGYVRLVWEELQAETARADAADARFLEVREELMDAEANVAQLEAERDAVAERLAIQVELNLALEEVVNELELRLGVRREYSDGG